MSGFELFLLSKGYVRYVLNYKTMRFEKPNHYLLSTLGDIDYKYYPKDEQIEGKKCTEINRRNEIVFGLHEAGKPPTLISPRPKGVFEDDEMNRILMQKPFDDILKEITKC